MGDQLKDAAASLPAGIDTAFDEAIPMQRLLLVREAVSRFGWGSMTYACDDCGSKVEVHHGLEGTSHYRPVAEEGLEAAEARARKATAALEAIADEVTNGVTANLSFIEQLARAALATIREGN